MNDVTIVTSVSQVFFAGFGLGVLITIAMPKVARQTIGKIFTFLGDVTKGKDNGTNRSSEKS